MWYVKGHCSLVVCFPGLGKWNNLFTANVKVTNTVQENLAVTEVIGEYMNKGRESDVFALGKHRMTVM